MAEDKTNPQAENEEVVRVGTKITEVLQESKLDALTTLILLARIIAIIIIRQAKNKDQIFELASFFDKTMRKTILQAKNDSNIDPRIPQA
jgi:hypothetical protein